MKLNHRNHKGIWQNARVALKGSIWGSLVAFGLISAATGAEQARGVIPTDLDKLQKLYVIRTQQIPLMEDFIRKYPQAPKRPDTLYRLGEAYFETAKYLEITGDAKGAESRQFKALDHLEELRKSYPTYPRLDEALFVLANTYMERRMVSQAGSVLSDIADRFPDSPVIQQASLLLGDHYFASKQFGRAESYYIKAADDEKIKSYIHYKLGWNALNQDQPAKALKYFEMVLNEKGGASDYSKDAAREMIWPAIQVYGTSKVASYLEKTLKDDQLYETSLSSLASGLQSKDEHQAASQMFETLISRFPASEASSNWRMAQIKSEEALGHTSKVQSLVAGISSGTGAADSTTVAMLWGNAKKFHAEAQKTKDEQLKAKSYDMAIVYYQAYLSKAPASEANVAPASFYLGEAYYARNKFPEALAAYETSSKQTSAVQAQAAWNFYLTAEKLADGFQYKGTDLHATSANDEKYLEAARMIQNVNGISPAHKRRVSYQSARLLYQLNDYDRALPVFKALTEQQGSTEEGKLSAQLILDIYNLKKDYKAVAELARNFSNNAQDARSRGELAGIEQKAVIKSINEDEKLAKSLQGESRIEALEKVSKQYLDYAKAYPRNDQIDGVLWAAFQNATEVAVERKSTDLSSMKESFSLLTQNYPNSKQSSDAIALMGKFLSVRRMDAEALRDYRSFRDSWARLMRETPREERGPMAMLVWKLSGEETKRAMEAEFLSYPMSESNREALANGKLYKVRQLHFKFSNVSLNRLKTMQKNTALKINLLDQLQRDVTDLAQMKVGEVTVTGLNVLSDANIQMASAFRQAPIPSQLTGENLSRYQSVVSEKAKEFEAKGDEARKLAKKTAEELGLSPG